MSNTTHIDLNKNEKSENNLIVKYQDSYIKANIIYKKRKSITIQIRPKSSITIISPKFISKEILKEVLIEKGDWILKKLDQYKDLDDFYYKERQFVNGEKLFYLGKEYILKIMDDFKELKKSKSEVFIFNESIIVKTNNNDKEYIKKSLKEWYKTQSKRVVLQRLGHCRENSETMRNLNPESIKVKEQKKRWGTCTSKRNIYINSKISMTRLKCVDYILVHEFCHLVHMNHSKDFYKLVESIMPDYKQEEAWLKENGYKLTL